MCMELQTSVMFITEHIRRDKQSKYCTHGGKEYVKKKTDYKYRFGMQHVVWNTGNGSRRGY